MKTQNFYDGDFESNYKYKGLVIHAARGLHEFIFDIIKKTKISREGSILVLGSGTGSFDRRLFDNGFKNIVSMDINFVNYKYKNKHIDFVKGDLNLKFSNLFNKKFDLIIAIEVVEHLYNPKGFLEQCCSLLKKQGNLVFSTPNLHDIYSRINNVLFGYPSYFIVAPNKFDHISPIYDNIIKFHIKESNLQLIKRYYLNNFIKDFKFYSYRSYIYFILILIFYWPIKLLGFFNKNNLEGNCSVYIVRKNDKE